LEIGTVVKIIDETCGRVDCVKEPILQGEVGTIIDTRTASWGEEFFLVNFGKEIEVSGWNILHDGMDGTYRKGVGLTCWWMTAVGVERVTV
jgi:hypothetical protein